MTFADFPENQYLCGASWLEVKGNLFVITFLGGGIVFSLVGNLVDGDLFDALK